MAVIQNHDHIRKNYYLYRDPTNDGRWRIFPWDLDLTFGHLYTDDGDTREEDIFTDESLFFGERVPEHDVYNQLISRTLGFSAYRAEFSAFVRHIAQHALTDEFVASRIDNVLCRATYDILADTKKRGTNEEYLSRVEEIRAFIRARKAYIATQL
jgi:spore coat protein CotH